MAVYSLAGRVQKAGARVLSHARASATSEAIVEAAQPAGRPSGDEGIGLVAE